MRINVSHDIARHVQGFDDLARRQIPFATARALTMTARDVQTAVREEMPKRFTQRSGRIQKGIRITPATKAMPVARVGSIDWFMRDQETGGMRRQGAAPKSGGHRYAVPTKDVRRNKREIITKGARPQAARNRPRAFIVKTKFGGSGIIERFGRGKGSTTKALYWLKRGVPIKPRLGFKGTAEQTIRDRFSTNMVTALRDAIGQG